MSNTTIRLNTIVRSRLPVPISRWSPFRRGILSGKKITLVFLLLFATRLTGSRAQNTWEQKSDVGYNSANAPSARDGAVGFSINDKGYVGTGNSYSGLTNDFWEYDPAADSWTQKADFGGSARQFAVGFSIGSRGYIGTGASTNDFWEYDPGTNTWTQKADFAGSARSSAVGFSIGTKGYIGTGSFTEDFWEYDPDVDTWTQKANFGGGVRSWATGFSIGSKGYIGTGWDGGYSYIFKKDFWEYDPVTDAWTQKSDLSGNSGPSWATGFSIGNKGYIGTGYLVPGDEDTQNFYEYDPVANTWTGKAGFGGGPRYQATGFSIGGKDCISFPLPS